MLNLRWHLCLTTVLPASFRSNISAAPSSVIRMLPIPFEANQG